jgi:hypothetical protein
VAVLEYQCGEGVFFFRVIFVIICGSPRMPQWRGFFFCSNFCVPVVAVLECCGEVK